jgi:tripartite-type tricarboxylate transporter receptor subunit TctC
METSMITQYPAQYRLPNLSSAGRRAAVVLALGSLLSAFSTPALAQADYPTRAVRLLVGFSPGGSSDTVARLIAKPLSERLGQNVVVENRPGAGGNIAAEMVAKAAPDGYTLVLLPSGHASNAAMKKTLPFDPIKDFAWVSLITTYPLTLSVAPQSELKSFEDLLTRIRSGKDQTTYTSVGVGTAMHLVGEWLMAESGGTATHVPFRGGTAPLMELIAGRVDVMIDTMTTTAPLLKDERVRVLAVTSPKGGSPLPGVPSVADTFPDVVFESWLGVAASPGTPPAIVERLNRELRSIVEQDDVRKQLVALGGSPRADSPDAFKARVEGDIRNLRRVVTERNLATE